MAIHPPDQAHFAEHHLRAAAKYSLSEIVSPTELVVCQVQSNRDRQQSLPAGVSRRNTTSVVTSVFALRLNASLGAGWHRANPPDSRHTAQLAVLLCRVCRARVTRRQAAGTNAREGGGEEVVVNQESRESPVEGPVVAERTLEIATSKDSSASFFLEGAWRRSASG